MNINRTRAASPLNFCVAALAVVACTSGAFAAPNDAALPDPTMVPAGERPRVERERAFREDAADEASVQTAQHSFTLEAGTWVNLKDVDEGSPPERADQPSAHRQGDALEGIAEPPQQPRHLLDGEPPHPMSRDESRPASRSTGAVQQLFDGIDVSDSFRRPPDTHLAVGPQYAVEVVNSGFSVFSKIGGTTRAFRSFDNFLAGRVPADWEGRFFDPRVVFDPTYQKFVILMLGKDDEQVPGEQTSGYWIAVSENADPRGEWCIRARETTNAQGGAPAWLDFAGLGSDAFGLYVTGNYLDFSDDSVRGAAIHSFPPEVMTTCDPVGTGVEYDLRWPGSNLPALSTQPAQAHTQNANSETFFVTTYSPFGDLVLLTRLSGNRGDNPTLASVEIAVPPYGAIQNNVDQPGSTEDIDGGKSWPLSAVYVDGRVLFSMTTAVAQTTDASGWLTVELDTDTNTRVWDHLQWLGEGRYLMYPALVYEGDTRDGNIAVFGSMTDVENLLTINTNYASGYVRFYDNRASDNGGFSSTLVNGTSPYFWPDDDMRNRWGDYSGGAYDWSCGHAWGAMQSANGPASWKTTIAALEFDQEGSCPQLFVTAPVWNQELLSDSAYFITWEADYLPSGDEIFVFYDTDDDIPVQIAGPLPVSQRTVSWVVPELPGDDIRIIVGSFDGDEYSALHYSDPIVIVDATEPQPNPPTWQNPPMAVSSEAIAMSTVVVIDGSGGSVQYLFDFAGNPGGGFGGAGRDWGPLPAYLNTGLQPNYEYCYRANARDAALNQTFYTTTTCTFTLANAPTVGSFTDTTNVAITVQANTNGNSDNTEYRFENLTTGLDSQWLDEPRWQNVGLLPDRTYAYRVKARNSDAIETAWTVLGAASTTNDDADGDGVLAASDNCLNVANADQRDTDGDNIGNACDFDLSQDCIVNVIDLGLLRARFFSADEDADFNGDGVVNVIDLGLLRTGFFQQAGPSGRPNACVIPN